MNKYAFHTPWFMLFLAGLLVGCAAATPTPVVQMTMTNTVAAATPIFTNTPTLTPTLPMTISHTSTPLVATVTVTPTLETQALPFSSGLVFRKGHWLMQFGGDGQPRQIVPQTDIQDFSPDGTLGVYIDQRDLWLVELATGHKRNLTNTPDQDEHSPMWWPAHPGVLLFQTRPVNEDYNAGYLASLSLNEGRIEILEQVEPAYANFAPSPDGHWIAYDRAGEGWLYDWETATAVVMDPTMFSGLETYQFLRLAAPAWSRDSQKLAWIAGVQGDDLGETDGAWWIVAAIFDLAHHSAVILHPYQNVGRGGWLLPPVWNPDGQWLAFIAEDVDPQNAGLWVVSVPNPEEHYLGTSYAPIWSPDGQQLIFTVDDNHQQLVNIKSWIPVNLPVNPGEYVVAWLTYMLTSLDEL